MTKKELILPESKVVTPQRKIFTPEIINKMVENEYLGLDSDFNDDEIHNLLMDATHKGIFTDPAMELLDVLSTPDYFYLTCKHIFNIRLLPFQLAILRELWIRKFPMFIAARGGGKTWLLSLYCVLRALFTQGSKIIVVGAAFRQSKLLFEYMEHFWRGSPIIRNMVGSGQHQGPKRDIDRCNFYIGDSEIVAIPIGDGSKIRGLRANYTIADEFASIPQEVYEVVIKGFSSVNASPDIRVKDMANIKVLKSLGMYIEAEDVKEGMGSGNQTVISGTAYYHFNHFYSYWKRYKEIIESKGDKHKLGEIFKGEVPEGFDWKQFSIFRIPVHTLPDGFMDMSQVHQAKALVHRSIYNMEYGACFARDSDGFFKRSLIESCVTKEPVLLPSGPVSFSAMTHGVPGVKYIYGIDPASEKDNFAIVILEVREDHRRIVYCWSINRQKMRERIQEQGKAADKSFYTFCAQKIRDLMKVFPTEHIGMDTQGGGVAIMEALHEKEFIRHGEVPLWPYIKYDDTDPFWWEDKDKPTDGESGSHILHMVQFANAKFTADSNHGLRKDFEERVTLFPYFDAVTISDAIGMDKITGRNYDTLEDCVVEIEELKDELATIQHTQTQNGRDKWDTPEVKLPGNKKGRLRKDRYTALIIANMIARTISHTPQKQPYIFVGGYAGQKPVSDEYNGKMYTGPEHIVSKMNEYGYGMGVFRR